MHEKICLKLMDFVRSVSNMQGYYNQNPSAKEVKEHIDNILKKAEVPDYELDLPESCSVYVNLSDEEARQLNSYDGYAKYVDPPMDFIAFFREKNYQERKEWYARVIDLKKKRAEYLRDGSKSIDDINGFLAYCGYDEVTLDMRQAIREYDAEQTSSNMEKLRTCNFHFGLGCGFTNPIPEDILNSWWDFSEKETILRILYCIYSLCPRNMVSNWFCIRDEISAVWVYLTGDSNVDIYTCIEKAKERFEILKENGLLWGSDFMHCGITPACEKLLTTPYIDKADTIKKLIDCINGLFTFWKEQRCDVSMEMSVVWKLIHKNEFTPATIMYLFNLICNEYSFNEKLVSLDRPWLNVLRSMVKELLDSVDIDVKEVRL